MICTPHKYHSSDQIEKNAMGGACSTYGGRGEVHTGFWWGNLRERDHMGDTGMHGMILWKWIFRKWNGGGHGLDWSGWKLG